MLADTRGRPSSAPPAARSFYGATPVTQPAGANQAAVTLMNTAGEIGGLPISAPPTQPEEMLALKRGYWVVESRLHHCLDISMREDQSRVRTPKAARASWARSGESCSASPMRRSIRPGLRAQTQA
jgi:hypothetical protein